MKSCPRPSDAFASLLRYHRQRQHLTGTQLEKKTKLPRSHVSQIETGRRVCGVQLAVRLATALDLAGVEKRQFLLAAAQTTQAPLYEALLASLLLLGFDNPVVDLRLPRGGPPGAPQPLDPATDFVFQTRSGQVWASALKLTALPGPFLA